MVEIREETGTDATAGSSGEQARGRPAGQGDQSTSTSSPQSQSSTSDSGSGGQSTTSALAYLKARPVDAALWILRISTVGLGFLYAFPIIGGPQQQTSFYSKTLIAACLGDVVLMSITEMRLFVEILQFVSRAATNALRLHQRLGGFRLSREFLSQMFVEDACHYLFYSILFLGSYPVTMALMPVFLFALLHAASFSIQLFTACGSSGNMLDRLLKKMVEGYSQNILTVIACCEIFLMPMVIVMIFLGRGSIFVPFIYYRFLSLRYMSRRNPNTRMAFYQMRLALEQSVNRPQCPPLIKRGVQKMISLIEKLCPTAAE